jgi:hypothetical protein
MMGAMMTRPMPSCKTLRRTAKKYVLALVLMAITLAITLAPAIARAADEEEVHPDARLEGYSTQVALTPPGGIAGTVVVLIFLSAITMGVMFINSKRSHLD